uniref:Uncharacterized protein n=1 Tax=Rhizophora mucronata TaxID=61149 RepID=A0A2P2QST6_RHIMU
MFSNYFLTGLWIFLFFWVYSTLFYVDLIALMS